MLSQLKNNNKILNQQEKNGKSPCNLSGMLLPPRKRVNQVQRPAKEVLKGKRGKRGRSSCLVPLKRKKPQWEQLLSRIYIPIPSQLTFALSVS